MKRDHIVEFVTSLWNVLSDTCYIEVIAWGHYGNCVLIHKTHTAVSRMLRDYFNSIKLKSFMRVAAKAGFRKVDKRQTFQLSHGYFQRNYSLPQVLERFLGKSRASERALPSGTEEADQLQEELNPSIFNSEPEKLLEAPSRHLEVQPSIWPVNLFSSERKRIRKADVYLQMPSNTATETQKRCKCFD